MAAHIGRHYYFTMLRILLLSSLSFLAHAADGLSIKDAYIRLSPPGAPLAGYGKLVNSSDRDIVIIDVNAAFAGMTMIHESKEENGVAKMRHIDALTVPAHGEIALQPGGLHWMFMQTPTTVKVGDKFDVVLSDNQKNKYTFAFVVKAP